MWSCAYLEVRSEMRVAFSVQQNTVISNNQIVSFCTLIAIDKALKKASQSTHIAFKEESRKSRCKCYRYTLNQTIHYTLRYTLSTWNQINKLRGLDVSTKMFFLQLRIM